VFEEHRGRRSFGKLADDGGRASLAGATDGVLEHERGVAEASRTLGLDPKVGFQGPIDTMIGDVLTTELSAVLREALSNVSRHAAASSVEVVIAVDSDHATLTVTDDGRGFDLDGGCRGGRGLDNLGARATRLGGSFEIGRSPFGGARVVPIFDNADVKWFLIVSAPDRGGPGVAGSSTRRRTTGAPAVPVE
jgi:signal transduction histidine kinase